MKIDPAHAWVVSVKKGKAFTDGMEVLQLNGKSSATIESVSVLGGSPSLEFLGASIASPSRRVTSSQELRGFPPAGFRRGDVKPAEGAVLKPLAETRRHQGYELLLGYRVTEGTYALRQGVVVNYSVNNEQFRAVLPATLIACPEKRPQEACMQQAFKQ